MYTSCKNSAFNIKPRCKPKYSFLAVSIPNVLNEWRPTGLLVLGYSWDDIHYLVSTPLLLLNDPEYNRWTTTSILNNMYWSCGVLHRQYYIVWSKLNKYVLPPVMIHTVCPILAFEVLIEAVTMKSSCKYLERTVLKITNETADEWAISQSFDWVGSTVIRQVYKPCVYYPYTNQLVTV